MNSITVDMIDPRGMDFGRYTSEMTSRLTGIGGLGGNVEEKHWKAWARNLSRQIPFADQGVPSPDNFKHWQDWAKVLLNYQITY